MRPPVKEREKEVGILFLTCCSRVCCFAVVCVCMCVTLLDMILCASLGLEFAEYLCTQQSLSVSLQVCRQIVISCLLCLPPTAWWGLNSVTPWTLYSISSTVIKLGHLELIWTRTVFVYNVICGHKGRGLCSNLILMCTWLPTCIPSGCPFWQSLCSSSNWVTYSMMSEKYERYVAELESE